MEAWRAWNRFGEARTPIEQANAVVDLNEAMSALATFLPGYDYATGTIAAHDGEVDGDAARWGRRRAGRAFREREGVPVGGRRDLDRR